MNVTRKVGFTINSSISVYPAYEIGCLGKEVGPGLIPREDADKQYNPYQQNLPGRERY